MLKALVFDVDGTLADTEETHRAAYNAAFVEHSLSWYWTHQRYAALLAVSGGRERLRYAVRSQARSKQERAQLLRLVPALHRTKTRLYAEFVAAGRVHLRPGIARLIAEARAAGLDLALVSSTTPTNIDALLKANLGDQARAWFRVLADGERSRGANQRPIFSSSRSPISSSRPPIAWPLRIRRRAWRRRMPQASLPSACPMPGVPRIRCAARSWYWTISASPNSRCRNRRRRRSAVIIWNF